jgi:hypothetical protein
MENQLDLASLFQTVTNSLAGKKDTLNEADTYNANHGDNMVEIFEVITQAMKEKRDADPADQLAYASQLLRGKQSGSAQVYSRGLAQASEQFQGQSITPDNAMRLIQTLLGGGEAPAPQASSAPSGDLLGSLLGGLTGGGGTSGGGGLDAGDLLSAGMAFMQSQQAGEGTLESIVDALVSSSQMGQSTHRSQSGSIVANTLLQMLGSMGGN